MESISSHLFWYYPHYGNQGGDPSSIIRKGDWKLIYYYEDQHCELYNLAIDISESEPLNIQYPEKVKELKTLLDAWLIEVDAKIPLPDLEYIPQKEAQVKQVWKTEVLQKQEKNRMQMFKSDWEPNEDWWGSMITID